MSKGENKGSQKNDPQLNKARGRRDGSDAKKNGDTRERNIGIDEEHSIKAKGQKNK